MIRAAGVTCLALLLLPLLLIGAPARAQPIFNPALLGRVMHLVLAQPSDYPESAPKLPTVVVVLLFLGADGAVLDSSLVSGSGDPALDAKSHELAGKAHRWTPLQVDGVAMGSMAILGIVWTPPGMALPTPAEQQKLLEMMSGQAPAPPPP